MYGYGLRREPWSSGGHFIKRPWVWIPPDTNGYFISLICCKRCFVCLKRFKKTRKRTEMMTHCKESNNMDSYIVLDRCLWNWEVSLVNQKSGKINYWKSVLKTKTTTKVFSKSWTADNKRIILYYVWVFLNLSFLLLKAHNFDLRKIYVKKQLMKFCEYAPWVVRQFNRDDNFKSTV